MKHEDTYRPREARMSITEATLVSGNLIQKLYVFLLLVVCSRVSITEHVHSTHMPHFQVHGQQCGPQNIVPATRKPDLLRLMFTQVQTRGCSSSQRVFP